VSKAASHSVLRDSKQGNLGSDPACFVWGPAFPVQIFTKQREERNVCFERRIPTHQEIFKVCLRSPGVASALAQNSWTILELPCLTNHIQFALACRKLLTAGARLLLDALVPLP
jgi:hypothetical protein